MNNGNRKLHLAALGILTLFLLVATTGQPAKEKSSFGVCTNLESLDDV